MKDTNQKGGRRSQGTEKLHSEADERRVLHAVELQDAGKLEEAAAEFRALRDVYGDPESQGFLMLDEAICVGDLGRWDDARRLIRDARRVLPREPGCDFNASLVEARVESSVGHHHEALKKLDRIARRFTDLLRTTEFREAYEDIQTRRGMLMVTLGRYAEAQPILEEVLALQAPKGPDFYSQLGICYGFLGKHEPAKAVLLKALELKPEGVLAVKVHYSLGAVYRRLGAYGLAMRELELAEKLAGESSGPKKRIYEELAKACRSLGAEDQAERYESLAKTS